MSKHPKKIRFLLNPKPIPKANQAKLTHSLLAAVTDSKIVIGKLEMPGLLRKMTRDTAKVTPTGTARPTELVTKMA